MPELNLATPQEFWLTGTLTLTVTAVSVLETVTLTPLPTPTAFINRRASFLPSCVVLPGTIDLRAPS